MLFSCATRIWRSLRQMLSVRCIYQTNESLRHVGTIHRADQETLVASHHSLSKVNIS